MVQKAVLSALVLIGLQACGGGGSGSAEETATTSTRVTGTQTPAPITEGNWYKPAVMASWQWQLSDTLDTRYDVEIYDIDLFDTSVSDIQTLQADGRKVICYFSAGSFEDWRDDSADFAATELGNTLDGWEDERWLDVRTDNVQDIMEARLDLAVSKGCDGVEPDNVDGYTNDTGFELTAEEQLAYNRFLANAAHERDLAVALKNDLDQIEDLVEYFDFAVNEQCFEYDECGLLEPFITAGKPVFNAEYESSVVNSATARDAICAEANDMQFSTLFLPLELDNSFRYSCGL